jgi:hypothetical protein
MQTMDSPKVGDVVTCRETGEAFTVERSSCSFNYARGRNGEIYSDKGVDIIERRELLDRSKPFGCYVSSDEKHVSGWKGNVLGTIISKSRTPRRWNYPAMISIKVRDVHGGMWRGRGQGGGMCITLRPVK